MYDFSISEAQGKKGLQTKGLIKKGLITKGLSDEKPNETKSLMRQKA